MRILFIFLFYIFSCQNVSSFYESFEQSNESAVDTREEDDHSSDQRQGVQLQPSRPQPTKNQDSPLDTIMSLAGNFLKNTDQNAHQRSSQNPSSSFYSQAPYPQKERRNVMDATQNRLEEQIRDTIDSLSHLKDQDRRRRVRELLAVLRGMDDLEDPLNTILLQYAPEQKNMRAFHMYARLSTYMRQVLERAENDADFQAAYEIMGSILDKIQTDMAEIKRRASLRRSQQPDEREMQILPQQDFSDQPLQDNLGVVDDDGSDDDYGDDDDDDGSDDDYGDDDDDYGDI